MGENTTISWTHHTFNPWWGCVPVSPACANCYAETFAERFPETRGLWGKNSERRFFGEKYWSQPLKWNKKIDRVFACPCGAFRQQYLASVPPRCDKCGAQPTQVRERVFCASMADVFEDRPELTPHRARLFDIIRKTPHLDWMLLTKRPENIMRMLLHCRDISFSETRMMLTEWTHQSNPTPPANVWLGTTVENQDMADKRIPELMKIPARIRFLSCEPLLGPVGLLHIRAPFRDTIGDELYFKDLIHWVICGGESGRNARPMHPAWARSLRNQCAVSVPFHFKQWGEWIPECTGNSDFPDGSTLPDNWRKHANKYACVSVNGERTTGYSGRGEVFVKHVSTRAAGRLLDGILHDAFPPNTLTC